MKGAKRISFSYQLELGKKLYFASDFHLGVPSFEASLSREKKIVKWLEHIRNDASAIFLVGDIFDFWFEYQEAIPKGYVRFQGKLAELADAGINIYFFPGNHDLWYREYFKKEIGVRIFEGPISLELGTKRFLVGHGDGLGDGDRAFKFIKRIFTSKIAQWLYRWIHPDVGIWLAKYWSSSSRSKNLTKDEVFLGEKEVLFQYCKAMEQLSHHDYYLFGHRHLPLEMEISNKSTYINLGEWVKANSYLEYDGNQATLQYFTS